MATRLVALRNGVIAAYEHTAILHTIGNNDKTVRSTVVYDNPKLPIQKIFPYNDGVITCSYWYPGSPYQVYFSRNGRHLEGGAKTSINMNPKDADVYAFMEYKGGLLCIFENGLKHRDLLFSPDGKNLYGGGNTTKLLSGNFHISHCVPYRNGLILHASNYSRHKVSKLLGSGAYYSPDGRNLLGGGKTENVYSGKYGFRHLMPYKKGIMAGFREVPNVYFSPNGKRIGGGGGTELVYGGKQIMTELIPYKKGVLASFAGSFYPTRESGSIYFSPNGKYIGKQGAGKTKRVYSGSQYVYSMVPFRNGIVTAFNQGGIYYSPDGNNLGGGGNTIRLWPKSKAHK